MNTIAVDTVEREEFPTEYVRPEWIGTGGVTFDVCRYDHAGQILEENHVDITGDGIEFAPIVQRLIYPAEMDLMARIAGLELTERWGGWENEPFASDTCHRAPASVSNRPDT